MAICVLRPLSALRLHSLLLLLPLTLGVVIPSHEGSSIFSLSGDGVRSIRFAIGNETFRVDVSFTHTSREYLGAVDRYTCNLYNPNGKTSLVVGNLAGASNYFFDATIADFVFSPTQSLARLAARFQHLIQFPYQQFFRVIAGEPSASLLETTLDAFTTVVSGVRVLTSQVFSIYPTIPACPVDPETLFGGVINIGRASAVSAYHVTATLLRGDVPLKMHSLDCTWGDACRVEFVNPSFVLSVRLDGDFPEADADFYMYGLKGIFIPGLYVSHLGQFPDNIFFYSERTTSGTSDARVLTPLASALLHPESCILDGRDPINGGSTADPCFKVTFFYEANGGYIAPYSDFLFSGSIDLDQRPFPILDNSRFRNLITSFGYDITYFESGTGFDRVKFNITSPFITGEISLFSSSNFYIVPEGFDSPDNCTLGNFTYGVSTVSPTVIAFDCSPPKIYPASASTPFDTTFEFPTQFFRFPVQVFDYDVDLFIGALSFRLTINGSDPGFNQILFDLIDPSNDTFIPTIPPTIPSPVAPIDFGSAGEAVGGFFSSLWDSVTSVFTGGISSLNPIDAVMGIVAPLIPFIIICSILGFVVRLLCRRGKSRADNSANL